MCACYKGTKGVEVHTHSLLTSAVNKSCELHTPNALPPGKETTIPIREEEEETGWASDPVLILWRWKNPLPLLGRKQFTCHYTDNALAVHHFVSPRFLEYRESDNFSQRHTMAVTLMTYTDSFSNRKILVTREQSSTVWFLTWCGVRRSGYSIRQNTAEQTFYGKIELHGCCCLWTPTPLLKIQATFDITNLHSAWVADYATFHGICE